MSLTSYDPNRTDLLDAELVSSSLPEWVALAAPVAELAERLAGTEFVPKAIRNSPASIAATILYGHELGIGPMQSLASIDIIEGSPSASAELVRAQILRAGHEIWPVDASKTRATVAGRRKGETREHSVEWTIDDARQANLIGKNSWRHYPRAMLLARATYELARQVFPDVIRGLAHDVDATPDALDTSPEPAQSETASPTTTVKRRPGRPRKTDKPQERPSELAQRPEEPGETPTPPETPGSSGASERAAENPPKESDEPPSDEPSEGMSPEQRARMNATFRELGIDSREDRLGIAAAIIGRSIDTSSDLDAHEASLIISRLDRARDGQEPLPEGNREEP